MSGVEPGGDPEALGGEREEYPDPESYPAPEIPDDEDLTDGHTPDADLQVDTSGTASPDTTES